MSETEIGLRERKKQVTRQAIADATLRLALDKGLEHVTLEDIAEEAFVSPRTVSNYFSCKEEALVAAGSQDALDLVGLLRQRPPGEPPLQALRDLLLAYVAGRSPEQLQRSLDKVRLGERYPSVQPFVTAQYASLEAGLREVVAERTGTSVDDDVYPWLVAAAMVSAITAVLRVWDRRGAHPGELTALVEHAFDEIGDGLTAPKRDVTPLSA
ncbi:MAG TPA: TetR/AcrR family transcriptional regulator [Intrasporangium sp.]|uniref:TetR/AcrR family transcriptional regulator n=1 Tax=Intrasporangium sp. TaxID=1925024 RepID=UPI002D76E05F|nr:TetR/AcrR family transcriptional regulator [Intrasporangium sp.]HET7399973.1 TetR/AcrR family transcriptional regulator [Intrasporangium sp.]